MKLNLYLTLAALVISFSSCISQENPPLIETPDQTKYGTETIVDGIEVPACSSHSFGEVRSANAG